VYVGAYIIIYSVVIDDFYIKPLSASPFRVKYFQPLTLSFQVAVQSNGICNNVRDIFLERPGSNKPLVITNEAKFSQVFAKELGFAGVRSAGNYTACEYKLVFNIAHEYLIYFNTAFMLDKLFGSSTIEVIVESKLFYRICK